MENHNSMAEMMEQIEESLKIPRRGSIVKGSVIQVNEDVVIVNVGYKSDGVIPKNEISSLAKIMVFSLKNSEKTIILAKFS